MYNGIGLRTVRGSGTNGYVQRNLSYVNASRTRQTLARNQRGGGSSGDFGSHGSGRKRPPPNADILLHEKKRKVELQLLEISLEMEDRGCDPEEIQEKVTRERERLLTRMNEGCGQGKKKDVESSHARQKRKEEENKRIKDAFGIATDYVVGESFDPEMQERRRQQRKEKKEKEWKEREEGRQKRLKEREETEEKMKARQERFRSHHARSRSPRRSSDERSRSRDARKLNPRSRSPVKERLTRRSSAERNRRSVSSSGSQSNSSRSCSRSRSVSSDRSRSASSASSRSRSASRSRRHSSPQKRHRRSRSRSRDSPRGRRR